MRGPLPLKVADLQRTLNGSQHNKFFRDAHGGDLFIQRDGRVMLAVDGVKVQGKLVLEWRRGRWSAKPVHKVQKEGPDFFSRAPFLNLLASCKARSLNRCSNLQVSFSNEAGFYWVTSLVHLGQHGLL